MVEIRHASPSDMPRLMELGRKMHAESPALSRFALDEKKVEAALAQAMRHGLVLVHINDSGDIDAGFAGVLIERWFSKSEMFADLALFVEPDRRGGLVAARLILKAITWAEQRGLKPEDVQFGISTGVSPERTGQLFERLNFERFGGIYRLKEF